MSLCVLPGCARWAEAPAFAEQFDKLIDRQLVELTFTNTVQFSFNKEVQNVTQLVYNIGFPLGTTDQDVYSYGTISVAPAGQLLDPVEYDKHKAEVAEHDLQLPPDHQFGPTMFPPLGKRAMWGIAYGPNGGGITVIFTTSDGKFDIDVSQRSHSKEGLHIPVLDAESIAKALCKVYDARQKN